jgi:hypothetical protein
VILLIHIGACGPTGSTPTVANLMLARALIGLGVATAFMAGLKAILLWVPVNGLRKACLPP